VKFFQALAESSKGFSISENEVVDLLAGVQEDDMEDIDDDLDTYEAEPPFIFSNSDPFTGNIKYGRWQWLDP